MNFALEKSIVFTPFNITRIKHVTNKKIGSAYFDLEKQDVFILHFPNRRASEALAGEIIVLYQHINNQNLVTHLVTPIDNEVINILNDSQKFGRKVRLLAFTNNQQKIKFSDLQISCLNFRNRGWGSAEQIIKIAGNNDIENFQIDIWNNFEPYFRDNLKSSDKLFYDFVCEIENDANFSVEEGKRKLANHFIRERNQQIINNKKKLASKENKLYCEICGFDFSKRYGTLGDDFIECHHKIPIATGGFRETSLEDLALVCSNCHRMLHRRNNDGNFLSIEQLKEIIYSRR